MLSNVGMILKITEEHSTIAVTIIVTVKKSFSIENKNELRGEKGIGQGRKRIHLHSTLKKKFWSDQLNLLFSHR